MPPGIFSKLVIVALLDRLAIETGGLPECAALRIPVLQLVDPAMPAEIRKTLTILLVLRVDPHITLRKRCHEIAILHHEPNRAPIVLAAQVLDQKRPPDLLVPICQTGGFRAEGVPNLLLEEGGRRRGRPKPWVGFGCGESRRCELSLDTRSCCGGELRSLAL